MGDTSKEPPYFMRIHQPCAFITVHALKATKTMPAREQRTCGRESTRIIKGLRYCEHHANILKAQP